jgi:hypothetical protein
MNNIIAASILGVAIVIAAYITVGPYYECRKAWSALACVGGN